MNRIKEKIEGTDNSNLLIIAAESVVVVVVVIDVVGASTKISVINDI
jgi:hypothetical protein